VLSNPDSATNACALARLSSSALGPAGAVRSFPARTVEDVERAFVAMAGDGVDGLLVLPDPLFAIHAARLVELAAEARLPAAYSARAFVEAGGLMALYGDTGEVIRRTVEIVRQILAGRTAATVSLPARLRPQVAFNVPAAKRLGLSVPPALLAAADVIITR
jgi:putative ABC transport system substrate-binding protein